MAEEWTALELREWRARMRYTQVRAAEALLYHLAAYKKLELGTRAISPRTRKLAVLLERERARSLMIATPPGQGGKRQVFATAQAAAERMEALTSERRKRGARASARHLALFAGLGGATAALERLGADASNVGFSEIDAAGLAVLRYRWPDVPRLGDITEVDWARLRGHVDIVTGGPPCQSFSVAGRRLGLADPRGNLLLHFLRAVQAVSPRWFVLENVPGLLTANDGEDFGTFLDAVEESGYSCAWRVLDARHFGLAQRRKRVWIVGERGGSARRPAEILAVSKSQARDNLAIQARWNSSPRRVGGRPGGEVDEPETDWSAGLQWLHDGSASGPDAPPPSGMVHQGEIIAFKPLVGAGARGIGAEVDMAPTLGSASGGNRSGALLYAADLRHGTLADVSPTVQVGPGNGWSVNASPFVLQSDDITRQVVLRRFTPLECSRLQGLDDDWLDGPMLGGKPLSDSDRYRLLGNAFPVPVAAWVLERVLAVHPREPE